MANSEARAILASRMPDELVAQITGNVSRQVKEIALKWLTIFRARDNSFANGIAQRVKVVEVSMQGNPDDPSMKEGRVVCEVDVTEDMLNSYGVLHDGCAFLLFPQTRGSVVSIAVLKAAEGRVPHPGVSQAINTVFHNPAELGAKLRIVSTSVTVGEEMMSSRSEVCHRESFGGEQVMNGPDQDLGRGEPPSGRFWCAATDEAFAASPIPVPPIVHNT